MDIHFDCTCCGDCCRNIKIPLTAVEAVEWLHDGNEVQIICEAASWADDASAQDPAAAHFKRRSFAAMSGGLRARVVAFLVANIAGNCPNLQPDMRCGIYERRPLVCRIYPAEINPLLQLDPTKKACPTEAWAPQHPLLLRDGKVVNEELRQAILGWRAAEARDIAVKRRVCELMNLRDAAVAHEGFLVYSPPGATLLRTLLAALHDVTTPEEHGLPDRQWRFVTDRPDTFDRLTRSGALACHARDVLEAHRHRLYIGFKRPAAS